MLVFMLLLAAPAAMAQSAAELHETARSFMQQADYSNAILVLNRAAQSAPADIEVTKDLAMAYYFQKDNNKALETIKPVLEKDEADDQCFQIAGNIYKQLELVKDCEKLYRRGIKKFPDSGPLYNDLGELLWAQQDYSAVKMWEKGIEVDAGFSKNYYNASKYYYLTTDRIWGLLYGEIFVNMEPFGNRTPEIKSILLQGYKKLFTETDLTKINVDNNKFAQAVLQIMNKQSGVAARGINAETLVMIRTRFILDWFNENAASFPYRLFEQQRQLLQDGSFEAYNQWLFASVENLSAYQNWTATHATEYNEFTRFQKGRIFKIPQGQYYH